MNPILFTPDETAFDTNGIGILSDALECHVIQVLNGQYELTLRYPVTGVHYKNLARRAIILAKPDPVSDPQPFRIYRRLPSSSGTITVYARHIAYDLMGVMVSPFSASGVHAAMQALADNAVTPCPFTFWTDKTAEANMTVPVPSSVWPLLGGSKGSVLDCFGGEYEFDRFAIKLWNHRGKDRGVSIRYGKNLTSLEQDENISNTYTGVYPYWLGVDGTLVQLTEKIIDAPGTYDHVRIMPLDLSQEWEEAPSEEQLRQRTEQYITANDIGIPAVSWKVKHVGLEKTEEYKDLAPLEYVLVGDTVSVDFAAMEVSTTARVVATDYDPIRDQFYSTTLGRVRASIADTIANQNTQLEAIKKDFHADVQKATTSATEWLTNGKGYKVERRDDSGMVIDTLYMDTPDIETAVNVLRIGQSGIGFSQSGVDGPYYSAWTLDGVFDASVAKVINLIAERLLSASEDSDLEVSAARLEMRYKERETFHISNEYGNRAQVGFRVYDDDGNLVQAAFHNAHQLSFGGPGVGDRVYFGVNTDTMAPYLILPNAPDSQRTLSWKDNGDGTYSLIGT